MKNNSSVAYYTWMGLLLIIIALGIYAAMVILTKGHRVLEITTEVPWDIVTLGIPWGILISTYVFFVVSSTGICIISSLGHVFGMEGYKLIGRRAVFLSIITLISGYIPLLIHLGHPERLYNFILTPNFSSSMWWMGFFYTFYLVFILIEFWFLIKENMKWVQITGFVAVVAAVSAHTTLGTIFSRVEARALWYGSYYPLYFILSAIISGAAILTFLSILTYWARRKEMSSELKEFLVGPFRRLFAFLLIVGILFVGWKVLVSVRHIETYSAVMLLLQGPFSFTFWGVQMLLGAIIPFLILVYPRTGRTPSGLFIASLFVIIGIFTVRYDWTIAGQIIPIVPLLKGLLSYTPSYIEILIVSGATAFCALLYTLGVKYLPLEVEKV